MRVLELPGVFRPISDTWLLAGCLRAETLPPRASVLDVCTGSGALAVSAALRGARDVTAVDVSRKAMLSVSLNARLNGVRVRAVRGDLFAPLGGRRFDAIVSNPPYVPSEEDAVPEKGLRRAWEGGHDGRLVLDGILDQAPDHLHPGGSLLVTHSTICGLEPTLERMRAGGLDADVVARHRGPLGPLHAERVELLEERGLLARGQREEEVLVIRGRKPRASTRRFTAGAPTRISA